MEIQLINFQMKNKFTFAPQNNSDAFYRFKS